MRIPPSPPKLEEFLNPRGPDVAAALLKLFQPAVHEAVREVNDQYLHWDKVRYRPCPPGVSARDMWHAVQLSRQTLRQSVPLSFNRRGRWLSYVPVSRHLEWLHHLDRQGGVSVGAPAGAPPGELGERYLLSSLMEEAIASSQLEGASTTRKVAKEMLRSNRKPRTEAERMIANNYRALREVRELSGEKLTPGLLCHLQEVLTRDTLPNPDAVGRFRRGDESVQVVDRGSDEVLHTPPPAAELEWRMEELSDFAHGAGPFVHPLVRASILHFALGYLHPFVDGNGRTARALFYWSLLREGYAAFEYFPISRVLVRSPARYARAYLHTETDSGDATYFVGFSLQVLAEAMGEFRDYVARQQREAREAARVLEGFPGLNARQRAVLLDALREPRLTCTFRGHQGRFGVTNPTARADLLGLVRLGLLRPGREGKVHVFRPASNLKELLGTSPTDDAP